MAEYEGCWAKNECTENESDAYYWYAFGGFETIPP